MTSFFGGNPSIAHYTCHLSIQTYPLRSEARREAYKKISDAFGRERYFSFPTKDDAKSVAMKEEARKACEEHAAKVLAKTGIAVEVSEGFFL